MNIKITENIAIEGQHISAGETIDIDEEIAKKLILMKRAELVPDGSAADTQAAALVQARADLLELIGAAQSVEELNDLLSEDPEVVAAYEARLLELEDDH